MDVWCGSKSVCFTSKWQLYVNTRKTSSRCSKYWCKNKTLASHNLVMGNLLLHLWVDCHPCPKWCPTQCLVWWCIRLPLPTTLADNHGCLASHSLSNTSNYHKNMQIKNKIKIRIRWSNKKVNTKNPNSLKSLRNLMNQTSQLNM